ncbi:hypothetical protein [Nocardia sp. NPDC058497]|uniref:hypothetical protein n=1 Tax=Nocardia sp. NPDC058497 TaxID=3346529 RepID=UPI00365492D0
MAKIAEAATQIDKIRGPLDWQRQVELWGDRQLLHDMMMFGHQHLQGRTPEQGWRHEHPQKTSLGPRRHDTARVTEKFGRPIVNTTTEYKAGWVSKKEGLRQLYKEREILAKGLTQDLSEYVIRAAQPPHPEVLKEARQLAKDFPGKFVLIEMSEREFQRCVDAGRPIVQARVMQKLGHLIEKVRQSPELQHAPRALKGFIQEIEKAKERGDPIGLEVLAGARVEFANMLEVDKRITQERDKIARERTQLRLREAQIVELVQAQQREERHENLSQMAARIDREIILSAVAAVRVPGPNRVPVKDIKLRELAGADPTLIAMAQSMEKARAEMSRAANHRTSAERAQQEREALSKLVLPTPLHHAVVQLVLEQQRDNPGQVTVEHVQAAEREVREREARAQEKAREAQAREVRERENRELMQRVVDRYNRTLEQAAREQAAPRGVDQLDDAKRGQQYQLLAKDLRMDAKRLTEKGVDARAVTELAKGNAREDKAARAYVIEAGDRTIVVGRESQEVAIAKQIQLVERGADLELVQVRQMVDQGRPTTAVAISVEDLERKRDALELERRKARERHPSGRTRQRGRDGPERGKERGR